MDSQRWLAISDVFILVTRKASTEWDLISRDNDFWPFDFNICVTIRLPHFKRRKDLGRFRNATLVDQDDFRFRVPGVGHDFCSQNGTLRREAWQRHFQNTIPHLRIAGNSLRARSHGDVHDARSNAVLLHDLSGNYCDHHF